jgi:hypothetical protein
MADEGHRRITQRRSASGCARTAATDAGERIANAKRRAARISSSTILESAAAAYRDNRSGCSRAASVRSAAFARATAEKKTRYAEWKRRRDIGGVLEADQDAVRFEA